MVRDPSIVSKKYVGVAFCLTGAQVRRLRGRAPRPWDRSVITGGSAAAWSVLPVGAWMEHVRREETRERCHPHNLIEPAGRRWWSSLRCLEMPSRTRCRRCSRGSTNHLGDTCVADTGAGHYLFIILNPFCLMEPVEPRSQRDSNRQPLDDLMGRTHQYRRRSIGFVASP